MNYRTKEPNDITQIEMISDNVHQKYISIGSYGDAPEGILSNWPRGDHPGVIDWQKTLTANDLVNKLLLVGSFMMKDVRELLEPEMIVFVDLSRGKSKQY